MWALLALSAWMAHVDDGFDLVTLHIHKLGSYAWSAIFWCPFLQIIYSANYFEAIVLFIQIWYEYVELFLHLFLRCCRTNATFCDKCHLLFTMVFSRCNLRLHEHLALRYSHLILDLDLWRSKLLILNFKYSLKRFQMTLPECLFVGFRIESELLFLGCQIVKIYHINLFRSE